MQKNDMLAAVVDMVAGVGTNMICESLKNWRFYFDDADRAAIQETLDGLKETAKGYGYSADAYLAMTMSNPIKLKDVKNCLELTTLASKYYNTYMDSLSYTDEQLSAYFDENSDSLKGVDSKSVMWMIIR